jgi:hypothetical protein
MGGLLLNPRGSRSEEGKRVSALLKTSADIFASGVHDFWKAGEQWPLVYRVAPTRDPASSVGSGVLHSRCASQSCSARCGPLVAGMKPHCHESVIPEWRLDRVVSRDRGASKLGSRVRKIALVLPARTNVLHAAQKAVRELS